METILDRIIPYIVSNATNVRFAAEMLRFRANYGIFQLHLLHDECLRVRVSAIHTINNCLMLIQTIPPRDANIFPEYILPALVPVGFEIFSEKEDFSKHFYCLCVLGNS